MKKLTTAVLGWIYLNKSILSYENFKGSAPNSV